MAGKPSPAARLLAARRLRVRQPVPLDEAAVLVGVSQRTLTRWVKAGTLPYVRSGQAGKLWFRRSDLQAFQQVD